MNAYRNLVSSHRYTVTLGKRASADIRNGDYADPESLDFAIATDMGYEDDYQTLADLRAQRAAGYAAAAQVRSLTGRATLSDISRAFLVPRVAHTPVFGYAV